MTFYDEPEKESIAGCLGEFTAQKHQVRYSCQNRLEEVDGFDERFCMRLKLPGPSYH